MAEDWQVLSIHERTNRYGGSIGEFFLAVARPSGSIVQVPMSEAQLLDLIRSATAALTVLHKRRGD